jgi:glycosyltransferase involved in cell wall biosynthesis
MGIAPRVSVILPSYNRLVHLRAAVDSVMAQTMLDFELLVADDGSDAATHDYLARLDDARTRVLWCAHSGNPAAMRNAALRAACGEYVAFLDSDDVWTPDKLARQIAVMDARPDCGWSYHQCGRIDASGNEASWAGVQPWRAFEGDIVEPLLRVEALLATPTVMARRALVLDIGGFDEAQRFAEDYDLWLRLALARPACALEDRLAMVRVHAGNYSQDRLGAYQGWVRLYGKMQGLVNTAHLRRLCRERRAAALLSLAALQWRAGGKRAATGSALAALRAGWRAPHWWQAVARRGTGWLNRR